MGTANLSKNWDSAIKKDEKRKEIKLNVDKLFTIIGKYKYPNGDIPVQVIAKDLKLTKEQVIEAYQYIQIQMTRDLIKFTQSYKYKFYLFLMKMEIKFPFFKENIENWLNK